MAAAYLDIIVFAIVAAFLFFKLRNTLGTRHGDERKRTTIFDQEKKESTPVPKSRDVDAVLNDAPQATGVVESALLTQIALKDPSFDEKEFIQGAKFAFEVIVEAFAKGDKETLDPLLSPQLMDSFEAVINRNNEKGYVNFTDIVQVKKAEITDCTLNENIANITLKFVAEEIRYIKNKDGDVISGDPDQIHEIKDIWTFQKNLKSKNPNWTLVKTQSEQ